jgi:elongation factor Tu
MFHKELDRGEAGDDMGTLLRGIKREQVRRGMVIAAAGSMKSHTKFVAQIYVSVSLFNSAMIMLSRHRL